MVVDFDDIWPGNDGMDLLQELKEVNREFKVTLFAVPGRGDDEYWDRFPPWVELAVHGWLHPDPYECSTWSYDRMMELIENRPLRFARLFRAPGWQISNGCYEACLDAGWSVADHPDNDHRRPEGLLTHVLDQGDHLHGHIGWNGSGNDLAANFQSMRARVWAADSFAFVSEAVSPWGAAVAA